MVVIDEALASRHSGWPFELYLMTAGIDHGKQRTRVLAGRGIPSEIIGRRLWDPRRVGIAAALALVLTAGAAWLMWPRSVSEPVTPPAEAASTPAAPAASVAAPAESTASAPSAASAASASEGAEATSAPASAPASTAASSPATAASEPDADAPPPDIRPRLVERADGIKRPPLLSSKPREPEGKVAEKVTDKSPDTSSDKAGEKPAARGEAKTGKSEPADPRLTRMAQSPDKVVVALVGPPGSKADAEALLKKMQASLAGVHGDPDTLQADVIQTPEGWRAAVWPFPSREQAQLINATLVARGFKTEAVNF